MGYGNVEPYAGGHSVLAYITVDSVERFSTVYIHERPFAHWLTTLCICLQIGMRRVVHRSCVVLPIPVRSACLQTEMANESINMIRDEFVFINTQKKKCFTIYTFVAKLKKN